MSEQPQIILEPPAASSSPLGSRNDSNLRSMFSASPIYTGDLSDLERKTYFENNALNGTVTSGNGLNSFNLDYEDAPNLEDVDLNTHNLPSPFMPNPTSPGPGSVSPALKPAYNGEIPNMDSNIEFGSGLPGITSPAVTSEGIAGQSPLLSTLVPNRSYPGSDGQS